MMKTKKIKILDYGCFFHLFYNLRNVIPCRKVRRIFSHCLLHIFEMQNTIKERCRIYRPKIYDENKKDKDIRLKMFLFCADVGNHVSPNIYFLYLSVKCHTVVRKIEDWFPVAFSKILKYCLHLFFAIFFR